MSAKLLWLHTNTWSVIQPVTIRTAASYVNNFPAACNQWSRSLLPPLPFLVMRLMYKHHWRWLMICRWPSTLSLVLLEASPVTGCWCVATYLRSMILTLQRIWHGDIQSACVVSGWQLIILTTWAQTAELIGKLWGTGNAIGFKLRGKCKWGCLV